MFLLLLPYGTLQKLTFVWFFCSMRHMISDSTSISDRVHAPRSQWTVLLLSNGRRRWGQWRKSMHSEWTEITRFKSEKRLAEISHLNPICSVWNFRSQFILVENTAQANCVENYHQECRNAVKKSDARPHFDGIIHL